MREHFSATIFKVGINPCVDVPARISKALGRTGYIPVQGKLNGHGFRAGLVSLGRGRHRLFINGEMRRAAGVDVDDRVTLVLEYDSKPRRIPVPYQLTRALKDNHAGKRAWEDLTPSRRKEILSYLNFLKRPETVERNVEKIIQTLLAKTNKSGRHK